MIPLLRCDEFLVGQLVGGDQLENRIAEQERVLAVVEPGPNRVVRDTAVTRIVLACACSLFRGVVRRSGFPRS